MLRTPYFRSIIFLVITIFVLHMVGLHLYLYWRVWWFDVLLHLLGGALIALMTLWVLFFSRWMNIVSFRFKTVVSVSIVSALVIGIGWEVFEYVFDIVDVDDPGYVFDTAKDLVMDGIGALAVAVMVFSQHRKEKNKIHE